MIESLFTLAMLVLLQAVLGFDNLLYISLESKRAPKDDQARVRKLGIGFAVGARIVLLFVLTQLVERFQTPFMSLHSSLVEGEINLHSVIVLGGGGFILWTAIREILHMMSLEAEEHHDAAPRSANSIIASIVAMNLVFSFDSILSAMALTRVFWVMALAIVIGGLIMIKLADQVAEFLQKNRAYEVLGLFVLFVVGVMLVSEGGHLAHLAFFGHHVEAMSKATFYFVIAVLVLTDVVQSRYKKKLLLEQQLLLQEVKEGRAASAASAASAKPA